MISQILLWVTLLFIIEMAGKIGTLLYMMQHGGVQRGTYRTWVLCCVFVPLAWCAYWLCGVKRT